MAVDCERAREAISALLDSEPPGIDSTLLEQHLAQCPDCRVWRERAHELTRRTRLRAAQPAPAIAHAVVGIGALVRSRPWWSTLVAARIGLVAVAVAQAAMTFPILILGTDRDAPLHIAHEMGSFDLALAIGFLMAAWRPSRAEGMRVVVGAAAGLLVLTAVIDLIAGRTTLADESPHLLAVAGWLLLSRAAALAPEREPWTRARVFRRASHRAAPLACIAGLATVGLLAVPAPIARADGDPGSDVLVYQDLFVGADAGTSIAQQLRISDLLQAARRAGAPIRVAIIAHPDDLGAVTALWGKPRAYARFLGIELSLAYRERLLVVMPAGFGFNWPGHATASTYRLLSTVRVAGTGADGLVSATQQAVTRIEGAAGVKLGFGGAPSQAAATAAGAGAPLSQAASGAASGAQGGGRGGDETVGLVAIAVLLALASGFAARRPLRRVLRRSVGAVAPLRWWVPAGTAVLVAAAVAIVLLVGSGGSTANAALESNPVLDPGTPLSTEAPGFTLISQFGQPVSLSSFRGKVVLLAFTDAECTTICPLTTSAMLDAKAMLGAASSKVQLLGIDANPKDTSIEDVLSYTQLHGMTGRWQFLTGSLPALRRVWREYGIEAQIEAGLISHTPALYVIGPRGTEARVYLTQESYAAVGQLGQLLAEEASRLLPSHPIVHSSLSYAYLAGTSPASEVALREAGAGRLELGTGHAHLLLFFATWDQEVTSLAGHLVTLDAYEREASKLGLPQVAAIDEQTVEPSRGALPRFLGTLPGPLSYPVAIDASGRIADGYGIAALPFLEVTSATGRVLWYSNVSVLGWPTMRALVADVHEALAYGARTSTAGSALSGELAGSPAPLAALHAQASRLLGTEPGLLARIRTLRGYPVVVNAWASWCTPCREEFGLLAQATAVFGRRVAFLGADTDDSASDAKAFLAAHHVSYPSYTDSGDQLQQIVPQGIEGLPTTIYLNRHGRVVYVHTGQYDSLGTLEADIASYALKGA